MLCDQPGHHLVSASATLAIWHGTSEESTRAMFGLSFICQCGATLALPSMPVPSSGGDDVSETGGLLNVLWRDLGLQGNAQLLQGYSTEHCSIYRWGWTKTATVS